MPRIDVSGGGGAGGGGGVTDHGALTGLSDDDHQYATGYVVDPLATHGFKAWTGDPLSYDTTTAPAAAVIRLAKIGIRRDMTITNIEVVCNVAGTSYTNTQFGLYSSAGTLLSQSAVYASAGTNLFVSTGWKTAALAAPQAITGGPTVFVWVAVHAGTNTTTAFTLTAATNVAIQSNVGLTAATARNGTYTGHATNTLQTIGNLTPSSIGVATAIPLWFAVT